MSYNAKRITLNILSGILAFFISILSVFLMLGIVLNIVYIKTTVRGYSMQPTLNQFVTDEEQDGDMVFVNRFRECQVGDIVVATNKIEESLSVIKRLVGKEGDLINIREEAGYYHLMVNGELLYSRKRSTEGAHGYSGTEDYYRSYLRYLNNHRGTDYVAVNENGEECIKVNAGEYFLMGDNWGETTDSLFYGPVSADSIIGRADFVVYMGQNVMLTVIKSFWEILT